MPAPSEPEGPGLRERKKARVRAAIQQHALRLFEDQGYEATTVSQIARAAEVSESTFFRYFATKEAVVLWDQVDPMLVSGLKAQPPGVKPVAAVRAAVGEMLSGLNGGQRDALEQRLRLMASVDDLRAAAADQILSTIREAAELVAGRLGRSATDPAVRALAGALVGMSAAAWLEVMDDPGADFASSLDRLLAQLEAGLPV